MDELVKAIDVEAHIRLAFVEATLASRALAARHLSGPAAAAALAEGLVAAALLSQDAASPDEAILLQFRVTGPIRGLVAEATGAGALRGYTHIKILPELDAAAAVDPGAAWGPAGTARVITSVPGRILNQASLAVAPAGMRLLLARYFNLSMQVPTAVELHVRADAGGLLRACGVLMQRMADSNTERFILALERFEKRAVAAALAGGADWPAVAAELGLRHVERHDSRPLRFQCRCTKERTLAVLKTVGRDELQSLAATGASQSVTCQMCGTTYVATPADLHAVLARQASAPAEDTEPTHEPHP